MKFITFFYKKKKKEKQVKRASSPRHESALFFQRDKRDEPTIESEFKTLTQHAKNSELSRPARRVGPVLPPLPYAYEFYHYQLNQHSLKTSKISVWTPHVPVGRG